MARQVLDRIARPYVRETLDGLKRILGNGAPFVPTEGAPAELVLHTALHDARSMALADMPRGGDTILSAGANGLWYFDWFDQEYGPVTKHIGVEAYMPRPDALPGNVDWVDADLAGPDGVASVASGSVDLVFSGQNIEHLWPEQMLAFLVESNRVLRNGGWIVVDSPNRSLTEAYQWSMSEHTVELTPGEAEGMLELAGFSVDTMKGLWLCRHQGELFDLNPAATLTGPQSYVRRHVMATQRPGDSFLWWAEARKNAEPDIPRLKKAIRELFETAWKERVNRIRAFDGAAVTLDDGQAGVVMRRGQQGYAMVGPHMALPAGHYEFAIEVAWTGSASAEVALAAFEVLAGDDVLSNSLLSSDRPDGRRVLRSTVTIPDLRFGVHIRLFCTGAAEITAPLGMSLSPDPWR
jgi:SAM-dependent methyltransferase